MNRLRIHLVAVIACQMITASSNAESATIDLESMLREKQSLEFNLAKVRVSLLQNNEELRELNERIIKLQKLLTKKLHSQPEVKFIQNKIDNLDRQITARKESD